MKRIVTLSAHEFCTLPPIVTFTRVVVAGVGTFDVLKGVTTDAVAEHIRADVRHHEPASERAKGFLVSFWLHQAPEKCHEWIEERVNSAPADITQENAETD